MGKKGLGCSVRWLSMAALLLAGCGDDAVPAGDGAIPCVTDRDCDDGVFCNGRERCDPLAPGGSVRGCLPDTPRCLDGQSCDEVGDRCVTDCTATEDADADGVLSIDCGGDDCDDSDSNVYPGAVEVCDADGVDEDCDPTTLGAGTETDRDGDGFVDATCCNGTTCGDDCNDTRNDVKPGQVDACDRVDNDCDGAVDEMAADFPWYPDCDGDLYGGEGSVPIMACSPPSGRPESCGEGFPLAGWSLNADDCNDTVPTVRPNAPQVCDEYGDNQCGGSPNPHDADGDGYDRAPCGRDCDDADPSRNPGVELDICDGVDEDCSAAGAGEDADGDGFYAPLDTCSGDVQRTDCNDFRSDVNSAAPEICDGVDNDCDGERDEPLESNADCQARSPLGTAICDAGVCRIDECPSGARDCNGVVDDGCESAIQFDPDHCGACGNRCTFACDSRECLRPLGVTVGAGYACALVGAPTAVPGDEGLVYCWGTNTEGQLGTGSFGGTYTRPTPIASPRGTRFRHVSAGRRHACAIDQLDQVWCWGANPDGQLGQDGPNQSAPVEVQGPEGVGLLDQVVTLDVGGSYGCVIRSDGDADGDPTDGTVWCWGENQGNLGDGTEITTSIPVQVLQEDLAPLTDVVVISTGRRHACAIDRAQRLWCWGTNAEGQLGRGPSSGGLPTAGRVLDPTGSAPFEPVVAVNAGETFTCTIAVGGQLYCWGLNDGCQLLDAPSPGEPCSGAASAFPIAMPFDDAIAVESGLGHVCLHRSGDQTIWCWGGDPTFETARLGRGMVVADVSIPEPVADGFTTSAPVTMSVRLNSGCAIRADDQILCWGANFSGQLASGDRINRHEPTPIIRPLY